MKKMLTTLLVLTALSSYSDTQDRLTEMREDYHKEAQKQMLVIQKEYQAKLEQALKKAEKFNHEEDAEFLREELEALSDPAYLLQKGNTEVRQFKGVWDVVFEGSHTGTYIIDRFGHVTAKDCVHHSGQKLADGDFGKIKYDPKTKLWVCITGKTREGARSFKIKGSTLLIQRWDGGVVKYPSDDPQLGKGSRTDA